LKGSRQRAVILIVVVAVAVSAACLVVSNTFNRLHAAKAVRITTAVVKAKEHVWYDEDHHTYVDDLGQTLEALPGTEEWRVYYEIDNFDQVPEPKRSQLWQSEEARIKKFGLRYHYYSTPEKATYDKAQVGDRLEVLYHDIGDEKEILRVRNLTHPDDTDNGR
jgi:hypothetical protein